MPSLPKYSGPYAVSVTDIEWSDAFNSNHPQEGIPTADPGKLVTDITSVLVRVYYPTSEPTPEKSRVHWLPTLEYAVGYGTFLGIPALLARIVGFCTVRNALIPASLDSPLIDIPKSIPVVIFSHGLSSCRTTLSDFCGELASYGFAVLAVEHRDRSACYSEVDGGKRGFMYKRQPLSSGAGDPDKLMYRFRNPQVVHRVQEILKTHELIYRLNKGNPISNLYTSLPLSEFKGRLDMSNITLAGHSFGGTAVLETLTRHANLPVKLAIALDAWGFPLTVKEQGGPFEYPALPILFLNSSLFHWEKNLVHLQPYVNTNRWYSLDGSTHQSFSDLKLLPISNLLRFVMGLVYRKTIPSLPLYCVWVFASQCRIYAKKMLGLEGVPETRCVPEIEAIVKQRQPTNASLEESLLADDDDRRFSDIQYGFPLEEEDKEELDDVEGSGVTPGEIPLLSGSICRHGHRHRAHLHQRTEEEEEEEREGAEER